MVYKEGICALEIERQVNGRKSQGKIFYAKFRQKIYCVSEFRTLVEQGVRLDPVSQSIHWPTTLCVSSWIFLARICVSLFFVADVVVAQAEMTSCLMGLDYRLPVARFASPPTATRRTPPTANTTKKKSPTMEMVEVLPSSNNHVQAGKEGSETEHVERQEIRPTRKDPVNVANVQQFTNSESNSGTTTSSRRHSGARNQHRHRHFTRWVLKTFPEPVLRAKEDLTLKDSQSEGTESEPKDDLFHILDVAGGKGWCSILVYHCVSYHHIIEHSLSYKVNCLLG